MTSTNHAALETIAPAIQQLLASSGLTLDEIAAHVADPNSATPTTTVAEAVAAAIEALSPGTVKTYRTYWRLLSDGITVPDTWDDDRLERYVEDLAAVAKERKYSLRLPENIHAGPRLDNGRLVVNPGFGDAPMASVRPFDIEILVKWVGANALAQAMEDDRRRAAKGQPPKRRHGKGAQENFIAATRSLYNAAQANGLVADGVNPAAKVSKPARSSQPTRRAMTDQELADVWKTITTTGDDPALDQLIFRLQLETASRQEGCINLRLRHLDLERQSIWLDQKNDELAEFPVTDSLMRDLLDFAHSRGATDPSDHVLRYKHKHRHTGQPHPPLTGRRFDTIHDRVHNQHRWANLAGWSSHWLRHHTAAQIESIGGRPCKMRILAHKPNGQTDGYARASFEHLAWAVATMTGQPHPLAQRPPWITG